MTTTTLSPTKRLTGRSRSRGFSLVEVLISVTLASFILSGVLSSFLFMGRSGANMRNYNDMEAQARKALEIFAEDVRQASAITWNGGTGGSTALTLTVNAIPVVYGYSASAGAFVRRDPAGTRILVTGIIPGSFSFKGYTITGAEITALSTPAELAAAGNSTKQLQISLAASRTNTTVVAATNTVLSARFILRNKIVTA